MTNYFEYLMAMDEEYDGEEKDYTENAKSYISPEEFEEHGSVLYVEKLSYGLKIVFEDGAAKYL